MQVVIGFDLVTLLTTEQISYDSISPLYVWYSRGYFLLFGILLDVLFKTPVNIF